MNQHECRRNKVVEVNDGREIVKGVIVVDEMKDYSLFPECRACGYGHLGYVLKSREPPFETYKIKTCTLRKALT